MTTSRIASDILLLSATCMVAAGGVLPQTTERAEQGTAARADSQAEPLAGAIETLIRSHKYDEADRLVAREPSLRTAAGYSRIGRLYFESQEWSRAADALQKSLDIRHGNDQAHLLLGLAWRELKNPNGAERELEEAARENPQSAVNAYLAGHQLLIDGKDDAALPHLYRAVELDPHDARALRAIGMTQARLGNMGLAESYYRKALGADPNGPDAAATSIDLAFLLLMGHDMARVSEGLSYASQAAKVVPASAAAHYLKGKALYKLGRTGECVKELQRAAELDPRDSKPHFLLAEAFDRLGKANQAARERKTLADLNRFSVTGGVASGTPVPNQPD